MNIAAIDESVENQLVDFVVIPYFENKWYDINFLLFIVINLFLNKILDEIFMLKEKVDIKYLIKFFTSNTIKLFLLILLFFIFFEILKKDS